jgi:dTDP-4-dehydrorhamnose 3,5-epimerase
MKKISEIKNINYYDNRGSIVKFYQESMDFNYGKLGQILISKTKKAKTVRGLHLQIGINSEEKMIFPLNGEALWFSIDLREGNEFKKFHQLWLNPIHKKGYYIPAGFAHGMLSISDNVELLICASSGFDQSNGLNININDQGLSDFFKEILPSEYIYDTNKNFILFSDLLRKKILPINEKP